MLRPEPPSQCDLCPRLTAFRRANAQAHPDWHNAPVASFGADNARILVVGLAPGLTGANRTGRPFTGDGAGDVLYAALARAGLSRGVYGRSADDGLWLVDCMVTNAVRCVPPENRPKASEIASCRSYLKARIGFLWGLRAILALGRIAHDSVFRSLGEVPSRFVHGAVCQFEHLSVHSSYHCSRYNMNTGRLTDAMLDEVIAAVLASV